VTFRKWEERRGDLAERRAGTYVVIRPLPERPTKDQLLTRRHGVTY
jgi:hypothetical protein